MANAINDKLIRVENLVKIYHMGDVEVPAVRGVNLDILRGEFVAIMGPSGSGKSTLMHLLGCLDKPTTGHYYLEGVDVSQLSRDALAKIRNQKIGFVFQTFNLLQRTTAVENVELPMLYNGTPNRQRQQQAREALRRVGLAGRENHRPNQLSGGEQQRVAIARALINHPSILLADEPTGNLDTRTSIEVMEIFLRLNEEGITIVLITHEPDIAQYATRNIHFRDGRVLRDEAVRMRRNAAAELAGLPLGEEELAL
jgi:putative ABC transport system ATP-binding protein